MFNYISAEAWGRVQKENPEVWAYLVHESLKGEFESLKNLTNPNDWQKNRLKELTGHFRSQYESAKEVGRYRKVEELKEQSKLK